MLELIDIHKSYEGKPLLEGVTLRVGSRRNRLPARAVGRRKKHAAADRRRIGTARIRAGFMGRRGYHPNARAPARIRVDVPGLRLVPASERGGQRGLRIADAEVAGEPNPERDGEALARVELTGFERRRVAELSGGEQQRVALARALAPRPKLLMLDEPLGALDRALREQLMGQLHRLLRELRIPSLYVTHDQEEAFGVAQRVALLNAGQIVQSGRPEELVARPASAWAADFLGSGDGIARKGDKHPAAPDPDGAWRVRGGGGSARTVERRGGVDPPASRRGKTCGAGEENPRMGSAAWWSNRSAGERHTASGCALPAETRSSAPMRRKVEEGEEWIWTPGPGVWIRD